VLFANQGCEMIGIKIDLLNDPYMVDTLIDRLAQNVEAVKAVSKASPSLNSANNTALMLASMLHKKLSEKGERGWYKKYQGMVKDMCERCDLARCDLTASTIERFRKAGELMLRCDVVACLLPSFVWVVEDALEDLLNDKYACDRLDEAFKSKLNDLFYELGESSVLRQLVGKEHNNDVPSFLETQAQNLLME
jgi:hypothetical protein